MRTGSAFDVIVVGVGGMGSASCYHLAERGQRVLGLERFDIPHAMGSSHGINRIIRLAYYEDPSYVPLLRRSFELWRDLQRRCGEQLLYVTGSIDASAADGEVFLGSRHSCELHGLSFEVLTGADLSRRFPGYALPGDHLALFQSDGGFLLSERCIVAHVDGAIAAGAEIHGRETVIGWDLSDSGVSVRTDRGSYVASRVVFAAGAWMGQLLPGLAEWTAPERQVLAWFQPKAPDMFRPANFPVFNLTVPEGRFYGFPVFGIPGFKVGKYHHLEELIDPDDWHREPNAADETVLREFTERYFPAAAGPTMAAKTCVFTNTPDEHFILDRYQGDARVIVASPCSGHGFKFCSVIGEIVADLVTRDETVHDISLFQLGRFST